MALGEYLSTGDTETLGHTGAHAQAGWSDAPPHRFRFPLTERQCCRPIKLWISPGTRFVFFPVLHHKSWLGWLHKFCADPVVFPVCSVSSWGAVRDYVLVASGYGGRSGVPGAYRVLVVSPDPGLKLGARQQGWSHLTTGPPGDICSHDLTRLLFWFMRIKYLKVAFWEVSKCRIFLCFKQ